MVGDDLTDGGGGPEGALNRRLVIERGRVLVAPYSPDADVPPDTDVAEEPEEVTERLRIPAKPREVEVRDLKAARAGRVFPCIQDGARYTGCIGYDVCKVLCWSPRPRERQALVRVEKPTGGPCRDCVYAREVRGEVAMLNGREVRLMECRLGYWHGRTTVYDFAFNKIALNVDLPCPGYTETDMPHPVVARMRETARSRKMALVTEQEEQPDD
jgi:hypothetical protein